MIAKLRIAVLAAGYSSRMGRPKALLPVGGVSMLRRTLLATVGLAAAPALVIAPPAQARFRHAARNLAVRVIVNRRRIEGLASSVRCAVWHSRYSSGLLLVPADLPALRHRDLNRLIQHWRALPRRLVARRIGGHGGIPLLLPRHLYRRALAISGDHGLQPLLKSLRAAECALLDLPSAEFDVDTPAELAAARLAHRA